MFHQSIMMFAALTLCLTPAFAQEDAGGRRDRAGRMLTDGNFRDAAEIFRDLALDADGHPKDAAADFNAAMQCYRQLGEHGLASELSEAMLTHWGDKSWRVLYSLAASRTADLEPRRATMPFRITRPPPRGRHAGEADRTAAILLMLRAEPLLAAGTDPATPADKLDFYACFADIVALNRRERLAWRLTALTNLDNVPDPEDGNEWWSIPQRNAPVDENGNPVYYRIPDAWDAAANDGERWRWLLSRLAASGDPDGPGLADYLFGSFLLGQFGVQTMAVGAPFRQDADAEDKTGPFAVRTLGEDETIARLASGLKRFSPPEEFSHIAVLRRAAENGASGVRANALALLAGVFENRQQYPKAVSFWQRIADSERGPTFAGEETNLFEPNPSREARDAIRRIAGNSGMLEAGPVEPAGNITSLSYLFRNGGKVTVTAKRLDERKLLRDIRARLNAESEELFTNFVMQRPEDLGRAVVEQNEDAYVAETVARWSVTLSPLPDHLSSRARIELPFTAAGCYLIEAAMENGNTSRLALWIADLALARIAAGSSQTLFVADAISGEGVPGAALTFAGYSASHDPGRNRMSIQADVFAERTDANGLCRLDAGRLADKNWLIAAETEDGRQAYLGFDHIWRMDNPENPDGGESGFVITDRPVYRPGQKINFKFWLARPDYSGSGGPVAGRQVAVSIFNPRGELVYEKNLTTDSRGGADDAIVLDETAPLGHYAVQVGTLGYAGFRLEEYRKPEFEVKLDLPSSALALGDKAQIKVKADYYYGAPVQNAKAVYRVIRTALNQTWIPPWRWDWLYGEGAWLPKHDYSWHPEFAGLTRAAPYPPWLPFPHEQPELVAEGEGRLDADGVFRLDLDTMPAKELYGDSDHSYRITVEVTDGSRRTIVGSGTVAAARRAFTLAAWTYRGHYNAGDEVVTDFRAMLPTGGGVKAEGSATLYRIRYDAKGTPNETEVDSRRLETDAEGSAEWRWPAPEAGQYRVACRLVDAAGNAASGSVIVTVRGRAGEGNFRFSALELSPDKLDYRPGETVRLAVNSENKSAVVLLFLRAERHGEAGQPLVLRLNNGTATVDIPILGQDQPNFFCQAVSIHRGRIRIETREIFVPPADRTLNVQVTPDRKSYAPGEKANFSVKVTDAAGDPVSGQCVVSLYDKSLDYIAGGTNVGDIRAQFWGRRRYFQPFAICSLEKSPYPVFRRGDVDWRPIGVFGGQEADWTGNAVHTNGRMFKAAMDDGYGARGMTLDGGVAMTAMNAPPTPYAAASRPETVMAAVQSLDMAMPGQGEAGAGGETGGAGAMMAPAPRSEFADTALWIAALDTDAAGNASFSLDMPENLTAWSARTWVMAGNAAVGEGGTQVETKKNIIVRPIVPRFLTQRDQAVLSAVLHNHLPSAKSARTELILEGGITALADGQESARTLRLEAGGEARVDWVVNAKRPGEARVVMNLMTDEESDAAESRLPVIVHGARRRESFSGVIRDEANEAAVTFSVPGERLPDRTRLELSFSPSIAAAMLDALPYLIECPYSSTEQTLNRFLPAVMTGKLLVGMGVNPADAGARLKGADTDDRAEEWKDKWGDPRAKRAGLPVFAADELEKAVKQGVDRLASMQNPDGGWGWFSGPSERSDAHATAVVVYGLMAARGSGAAIPMDTIDSGVDWLRAHQTEEIARLKIAADANDEDLSVRRKARADDMDAFIYMILALDSRRPPDPDMRDFLYQDRLHLSRLALAMFGIALHREKATNALDMVANNLRQYIKKDAQAGTAWLEVPADGWWWWHNDDIETQAWYLKFLARVDPRGDTASGLARYLLHNRKNGSYWRSTRDTASAIEALADYAAASGENDPDGVVSVYFDGQKVMERAMTKESMLDGNRFALAGLAVGEGEHTLRLTRSGRGAIYFGGGLDLYSLEDPIRAAGTDLQIRRDLYRLTPEDGTADMPTAAGSAAAGRMERYRRATPNPTGSAGIQLESGDLVEVELTLAAKNDCEYLVFEDMKAAGLEAVELRSGYDGNPLGAYVEYRDQKVTLFVRRLPRGTHRISYRFRAETPGRYSALPAFGGGMYATDLSANSAEMKVAVD